MKDKFIQPISKEIFFRKYALHGEKTEDEVFDLISQEVASVEPDEQRRIQWKNVFLGVLSQRKFIPAGRILANARPDSPMKNYQNCYVIPIGDSMEEIYQAVNDDALIGKMGGGVGFNISKLRPKGAPISKGGESSGPMSFLEVFDTSAKAIHTGGGRRGAHIVIMNCDHPDIEEFVTYKQGERNNRLTQFNISVGVTDKFMRAVERDAGWDLVFEGKKYKTLRARDLYNLIMENMFQHNEPGIFFLDEVQRNNSASSLYDIDAVNPCGEQPLPDYGCCCLGALNLTEFIKDPFTDSASFDVEEYQKTIKIAVRFLDNVLSASEYPLEKIKEHVLNERRIGLGYTGLGSAFAMLKVPYGSEKSKELSELIGINLRNYSYLASTELAKEKGVFPLYHPEMLNDGFYKTLPASIKREMEEHGMRNIALNTVAPTGCLTDDTVIQTTIGDLSIKEIFFLNELETGDVKDFQGEWIIPDKEIFVDTLEGEKRITKLFINGEKEVLEIKTKNSKIEGTLNHRVLVKISDEYAVWKELSELEEGDKILLKMQESIYL